ncbi:hypothetical protein Cni_G28774 [Canna indica]|uniref:GRAM domain-containing protein n=1 Tax=Canna indica TaxID=4628 RepID=A0AAQ3L634_9LILI|nr:hypothetical protein Cni_G28774 [Canna indica]
MAQFNLDRASLTVKRLRRHSPAVGLNVVQRCTRTCSSLKLGPHKPRREGRKRSERHSLAVDFNQQREANLIGIGMDSAAGQASKPRSNSGGQSPGVELPPPPPPNPSDSHQAQLKPQSQQSLDHPPTVEKSVTWSSDLTREIPASSTGNGAGVATTIPIGQNPYISPSPMASNNKTTMETMKDMFGRWRKKVGETAKVAEDLSRNTWQHLKTGPSLVDAAMGRIAQGTKVIAEGGYEKIFRQTFDSFPEEQLKESYACYLSTSAGPIMGILYLSTAKLAYCSDNPLPYKSGDQTEWSYYKVVIPLHQLRACIPSISRTNSAEKYIQIVSVDNHEFWFMGFLNYDSAVEYLHEALDEVLKTQT